MRKLVTLRVGTTALAIGLALAVAGAPAISAPVQATGKTVMLARGSVNGLAAAIAAAGAGGTVVVQSGTHFESGTVLVDIPVTILGKRGAVLISDTLGDATYELKPALHVRAAGTSIRGLEIRPAEGNDGNTAVLVQGAADVQVAGNTILRHQFGIMVIQSDRVEVSGNRLEMTAAWTTGALPEADGIVVVSGRGARVTDNQVANATFGIFASDQNGRASGNTLTDSFIGLILCKVPEIGFSVGGVWYGSPESATGWLVSGNFATRDDWGYIVIDGAHANAMTNNAATANRVYDLELTSDTTRFGFFVPGSYDNVVDAGPHDNLIIKDCGLNNTISGGTLVDLNADPCF